MINSISRNAGILAGFAVVTTLFIVATYIGTRDRIEQQRLEVLQQTLNQVMPDQYHDNQLSSACLLIEQPILSTQGTKRLYPAFLNKELVGLVVESTAPNGYSGNIHMLMGVLLDGTVTGVRVLEHKETPGLGDKIDMRVSDWILAFTDQPVLSDNDPNWDVKKFGGQFDQFTGATITPRAVVKQVEKTAWGVVQNATDWLADASECRDMMEDSNE